MQKRIPYVVLIIACMAPYVALLCNNATLNIEELAHSLTLISKEMSTEDTPSKKQETPQPQPKHETTQDAPPETPLDIREVFVREDVTNKIKITTDELRQKLRIKDEMGRTLLHQLAQYDKHVSSTQVTSDVGRFINALDLKNFSIDWSYHIDKQGQSPLHVAAGEKTGEVVGVFNLSALRALLSHLDEKNQLNSAWKAWHKEDTNGKTPFVLAAENNNIPAVDALLTFMPDNEFTQKLYIIKKLVNSMKSPQVKQADEKKANRKQDLSKMLQKIKSYVELIRKLVTS